MRFSTIGLVVFVSLLLIAGCAKKQEEASKLEQEMLEQERPGGDSLQPDAGAVPQEAAIEDSVAVTANADAVPEESYETFAAAPASGWTVQVAACEDRDYAEHLLRLFTSRGYEPYRTVTVQDGVTFHRVRIGAKDSRAEAIVLRDELVDRYSIAAWVDEAQ